jgi:hypothetical protein
VQQMRDCQGSNHKDLVSGQPDAGTSKTNSDTGLLATDSIEL